MTPAMQSAISNAAHDGHGWALLPDEPADVIEQLREAGLIRLWQGRWQLTPQGYRHHPSFR